MTHAARTKQIGWGAFLVLVAAAALAAWGYDSESSSRRGRGLEFVWHGVLALIGQEEASGWRIWGARALALAGVGLLAWYVARRVRGDRPGRAAPGSQPTVEQPPRPEPQFQPQHEHQFQPHPPAFPQQPQVQWSTGGPQPAPPVAPVPSWGAETSGPTPIPVLPTSPPQPASAPAPPPDATREVIIPPLPPRRPHT